MLTILAKIFSSPKVADHRAPPSYHACPAQDQSYETDQYVGPGDFDRSMNTTLKVLKEQSDLKRINQQTRHSRSASPARDLLFSQLKGLETRPQVKAYCEGLRLHPASNLEDFVDSVSYKRVPATRGLFVVLYLDYGVMLSPFGLCHLSKGFDVEDYRLVDFYPWSLPAELLQTKEVAQDLSKILTKAVSNHQALLSSSLRSAAKGQKPRKGKLYLLDGTVKRLEGRPSESQPQSVSGHQKDALV